MSKKVDFCPKGYHTVTPYLILRDAAKAIDFYKAAFGAEETFRMPGPDGKVMHAELKIGDSMVMLGEEMPKMGATSPQTVNGTTMGLFLYVKDVDTAFNRATTAGAKVEMPLQNMFWGDRYGKLKDPFGHSWSMATHIEDVPPQEMAKRHKEWAAKQNC